MCISGQADTLPLPPATFPTQPSAGRGPFSFFLHNTLSCLPTPTPPCLTSPKFCAAKHFMAMAAWHCLYAFYAFFFLKHFAFVFCGVFLFAFLVFFSIIFCLPLSLDFGCSFACVRALYYFSSLCLCTWLLTALHDRQEQDKNRTWTVDRTTTNKHPSPSPSPSLPALLSLAHLS